MNFETLIKTTMKDFDKVGGKKSPTYKQMKEFINEVIND